MFVIKLSENIESYKSMHLSDREQRFIYHFGEMGSRWGINRTVGQIYALLVLNEAPLYADQIAAALSISRGNVSMGIKELQSWGLVQVQHKPGDRKDYYLALGDVWEMARVIFEERRKREIEPTLSVIRSLLLEQDHGHGEDTGENASAEAKARYAETRMLEILDLLELVTQWSKDLQRVHPDSLRALMKMGASVIKILERKDRAKLAKEPRA